MWRSIFVITSALTLILAAMPTAIADTHARIFNPFYEPTVTPQTAQKPQECECSARLREEGKPGIGTRCVPEGIICSTREVWLDDEDPLPVIACKLVPGDPPTCEEIRTSLVDPLACSYGHKDASECVRDSLRTRCSRWRVHVRTSRAPREEVSVQRREVPSGQRYVSGDSLVRVQTWRAVRRKDLHGYLGRLHEQLPEGSGGRSLRLKGA